MNSSVGDNTGVQSARHWAWVPLPILLTAVIGVWLSDFRTPIESPDLLRLGIGLNFVFSTMVAMLIAFQFGRSFLVHRAIGLLLFGCGAVIWGAAGVVSLVAPLVAADGFDANTAVTIHNVCIWFASVLQLAGAAVVARHRLRVSAPKIWLLNAYGLAVGVVALTVLATLSGQTSVFFAPGAGGSLVRWCVLGSTIGMLALTVALLWPVNRRQGPSFFLHWYCLSLLLLMTGYLALMLESIFAGVLGWVGAVAQYLAGIYMLVAALATRREADDPLARLAQPQEDGRHPYAIAIAGVLVAAVLRLIFLERLGTEAVYVSFYPAVMLAALYGGLRAGALATVISAAIADYFWLEPVGSFGTKTASAGLSLAIFVANGVLVSWVADSLQRAGARLRRNEAAQRQELERLVAERTAELERQVVQRRDAEEAAQTAERQHRKSEEKLRLALGAGRMAAWTWDLATNACEWNDEHYRILGYAPGSVAPSYETWARRVLPEDLARIEADLKEMIERGAEYSPEYRALGENGEVRWVESRGERQFDKDGRVSGAVGVMVDVTKRKQAENALLSSQKQLQAFLENSALVAWLKDEDGRYVFVSKNYLQHFSLREEDALGKSDFDLWPRAVAETFRKNDLAVLAGEGPIEVVEPSPNPDGSTCWWLANKFHYRDSTGRRFVGGLGVDITERNQAELALALAKAEAERANLAKSKFLAAASHDLRQPVQSLTLLLSTIKTQVKDMPRTAKSVEMAKSAVDSLNGLLTGILDISKLDAGVVAPTIEGVNLSEIVERLAKEYAPRAAAEGLTLRHVPSRLWARTDASLMDRIIRNLIENALRYTTNGGILIGLRLRGDNVRIDVVDTGIGIPADKQAEIFEEFRQLDNPARDASRGLGLGLAIVSRLSRLLDAPVTVASRLGHGTRFSLLVPLERSEEPALRATPAFEGAGGSILVIEDDALIRQTYEMMLEDWGYQTLSAASGEEALDRAAQAKWRFDAIVADHRLGSGLTGNAAATEIARRAGRSYPTLLITGDTAKERLAEISGSGFIALHKPVEADDLRRTLSSLLVGRNGTSDH